MRAFKVRKCDGKFCEHSRLNCVGPIVVFVWSWRPCLKLRSQMTRLWWWFSDSQALMYTSWISFCLDGLSRETDAFMQNLSVHFRHRIRKRDWSLRNFHGWTMCVFIVTHDTRILWRAKHTHTHTQSHVSTTTEHKLPPPSPSFYVCAYDTAENTVAVLMGTVPVLAFNYVVVEISTRVEVTHFT